jgi:hypothetical protein
VLVSVHQASSNTQHKPSVRQLALKDFTVTILLRLVKLVMRPAGTALDLYLPNAPPAQARYS